MPIFLFTSADGGSSGQGKWDGFYLSVIKFPPVAGFLHPAVFCWYLDTELMPGCGGRSLMTKIQCS